MVALIRHTEGNAETRRAREKEKEKKRERETDSERECKLLPKG